MIEHWIQLRLEPIQHMAPAALASSAVVPTIDVTVDRDLLSLLDVWLWKYVVAELPDWVERISIYSWPRLNLVKFRAVERGGRRQLTANVTRELIEIGGSSLQFAERLGVLVAMYLNTVRWSGGREHPIALALQAIHENENHFWRGFAQRHVPEGSVSEGPTGWEDLTIEEIRERLRLLPMSLSSQSGESYEAVLAKAVALVMGWKDTRLWRCRTCGHEFEHESDVWTNPERQWDRHDCFCHPCYLADVQRLEGKVKVLADKVNQL